MNSEDIINEWNNDAPINEIGLGDQSRDIPKLHAKYYKMLIDARKEIAKAKFLYKRMRSEKNEFLINPTQEVADQFGWEMPDRTILKSDIKDILDGDSELLKIDLKAQEAEIKVDLLQDIMKMIHSRNWLIKNALDDRNFLHGD